MRPAARSRRSDLGLRGALLLPVCALAVHQLRYLVAFGSHAGTRLHHDGHDYFAVIEPFILFAAALAVGGLVGRIAEAWQRPALRPQRPGTGRPGPERPCPERPSRFVRVWAMCAVVLLVLYCGQELSEGFLVAGHPAGAAGVVGSGGWIAVPAAALVGAVLALALRTADALINLAARRTARAPRPRADSATPRAVRSVLDWRLDPGSGIAAARAPPLAPPLV